MEEEIRTLADQFQLNLQREMTRIVRGEGEDQNFTAVNPDTGEPIQRHRDNMVTVWDITAGVTNRAVGVDGVDGRVDREHYWFDADGTPTYNINLEFFADYIATRMRNDGVKLEILRHYFPEAMAVMADIMAEIFER